MLGNLASILSTPVNGSLLNIIESIIDTMPGGVAVINQSREFIIRNRLAREIFGMDPWQRSLDDTTSDRFGLFLSEDGPTYPYHRLPLVLALKGESVHGAEMFIRNASSPSGCWIQVWASPLRDGAHNIWGAVAMFTDITEAKRIKQMRDSMAAILDATPDFVGMADKESKALYVNPAGLKMTELKAEELRQTTIHDYHPDWATKVILEQGLLEAERSGSWRGITALRDRQGNEIPVSQVILSHKDDLGNTQFYSTIARDITDTIKAERQRRAHMEELSRSNAELERFAAIVSHDIQEPLRTITSLARLLDAELRPNMAKEQVELLSYITQNTERIKRLVQDLLHYARITTAESISETTDADQVYQRVIIGLSALIDEKHAVITHDNLPVIPLKDTHLEQLLQNLISNAIKYNHRRPIIHVGYEAGTHHHFWVSDNGIGFDASDTRVFEAFYRLHGRSEFPGSGIGLAICRRIVQQYGGRIWADSVPGEGSVFHFTLPIKPSTSSS